MHLPPTHSISGQPNYWTPSSRWFSPICSSTSPFALLSHLSLPIILRMMDVSSSPWVTRTLRPLATRRVFAKVGPDMFANNSPASVLDTGKSTEILFTRPVQYFCINNGEVDAEVSADQVQGSDKSMAVHGATYVPRARAGKRAAVPTTP